MAQQTNFVVPTLGQQSIEPHILMEIVAESMGMTMADYKSRCRNTQYLHLRYATMLLLKETKPLLGVAKMGRLLNREHCTIIHGMKSASWHRTCDPEFKRKYAKAIEDIKKWLKD